MRGVHIQVVKYHVVTYKTMYPTTNYTLGENYANLSIDGRGNSCCGL